MSKTTQDIIHEQVLQQFPHVALFLIICIVLSYYETEKWVKSSCLLWYQIVNSRSHILVFQYVRAATVILSIIIFTEDGVDVSRF